MENVHENKHEFNCAAFRDIHKSDVKPSAAEEQWRPMHVPAPSPNLDPSERLDAVLATIVPVISASPKLRKLAIAADTSGEREDYIALRAAYVMHIYREGDRGFFHENTIWVPSLSHFMCVAETVGIAACQLRGVREYIREVDGHSRSSSRPL